MSIEQILSQGAVDPKHGMTFGELRTFIQDGMRADVPDEAYVKQAATWRGTIKELKVSTQVRAG